MPLKPMVIHHRYASPDAWPSLAVWSAELREHQTGRRRRAADRLAQLAPRRRPARRPG